MPSSEPARLVAVHPNSMAAKKWRRTSWRSSRNLWAEARDAGRAGRPAEAAALRAAATRARSTELHCG